MSIRREIKYMGFDGMWYMDIMWNHTIKVTFDPEGDEYGPGEREYTIPEDITGIEHDTEYVHLTLKDKRVIQLKFEIDGAFIGDILDSKGEHLDTFACYSFWDDAE
jgi:hypothetical protein